jgi:aprataxin
MKPLHIHIISQDFDSPALKTKKHYLSFTSGFFLPAKTVENELGWAGKLDINHAAYEGMLKGELVCHKCGSISKTIPALKAHLSSCSA